MMLFLLGYLHIFSPGPDAAWSRPPVLYMVPAQQLQLQIDSGQPAKARRRSRQELLQAAWNASS